MEVLFSYPWCSNSVCGETWPEVAWGMILPAQCGCSQVVPHLCLCRWTLSCSGCIFFFNFLKSENLSTQKPSSPVGFQNRCEPDHPLSPGSCQPTVTSPGPPSHPASRRPTTTVLFICGSSCCGHGDLSTSTFVTPKTQIEYRGHADNFHFQFDTTGFSLFPIP